MNPCGPQGRRHALHHTRAMSVPGAAVPAEGYPPRQEKKAVLLPVRCHDAAGRAVNLPHLPCFILLLRSAEGGDVPCLEKHLGGQTRGVETVSGSHRGQISVGAQL